MLFVGRQIHKLLNQHVSTTKNCHVVGTFHHGITATTGSSSGTIRRRVDDIVQLEDSVAVRLDMFIMHDDAARS